MSLEVFCFVGVSILEVIMAENKKSVIIYVDWISIFDELSDEEAGKLVKHLFRYVNDLNPETPDRLTKLLFEPIKQTLKRDLVKYEGKRAKNKENILKRWNKKDTNEYECIKKDTNHTDSDSVNDNVSDSVSVNDNKEKKTKYADFVSMLQSEYGKLILQHGEDNTKVFIEILDNYKGSKGVKYKSDYRTILNWVIDRAKKDGKYQQKAKFVF
jgi:hypothetical protein